MTCDACGEGLAKDKRHYCSCGVLLCWNCYAEEEHQAHDDEPWRNG